MLEYVTAGESHGEGLTAVIWNYPAGVSIDLDAINRQLQLRQTGYGRGGRMKIEKDKAVIKSGVRSGYSLGSPITIYIVNKDYANWQKIMNPEKVEDQALYEEKKIQTSRPGHADLAGALKYHHTDDIRNVLERSSARETAARTAVGALCRQFLESFGMKFYAFVTGIGEKVLSSSFTDDYESLLKGYEHINENELRLVEPDQEEPLKAYLDKIKEAKNTAGGSVRLLIQNTPVGLGSYTHWEERLDGALTQLLMSIPAVKAIRVGTGISNNSLLGKEMHDEITYDRTQKSFKRKTNRAGGIEGGMSNGEIIDIQIVMKPIPTLMSPLRTVNMQTKKQAWAVKERSDVCAVPALSVVVENVAAFVIMRFFLKKFGMDNIHEIKRAYHSYLKYLEDI